MEKYLQLRAYGTARATEKWPCDRFSGIHRLYFIHSGKGGCFHRGKRWDFQPGLLYYIPFSEDFKPFCDGADPVLHTYADFDLFPPLIADGILTFDPATDEKSVMALDLFCVGAKSAPRHRMPEQLKKWDGDFGALCKESIFYLTTRIGKANGVPMTKDERVLLMLEEYHFDLRTPTSVEGFAERFETNPDSLIRLFRREIGITPHAYLKKLRLTTARLLRKQAVGYAEIAEKVGYSDASALLHALKNETETE